MKIAIYYVATKQYIMFFDAFKNGVEKFFFPNVDKKIVLITDCDNVNFEEMSSSRLEIVQRHIDHYYWPIPTLFKMFYIEKFFASDCDFHFYCNANMEFTKEFSIEMPFGMCFMKHYLSDTLSLYTINNGNNNNCVIPPSWAKCHISNSEIPAGAKYCQAGFFGGTSENVIHLLKNINEMIKDDLKHNIIPIWHDETYLNKYLLKFYWNHNVIGDVKIVDIRKYANLLDKMIILTNLIYKMYNTPILLICFKRYEKTLEIFNIIKSIKPKKLYVSVDGPRNESEKAEVDKVVSIFDDID